MIYYYSALIQFVAAIYVTLSFDNWLFRSLWSMNYAKLINERVEALFKVSSSTIEKHLSDNISQNAALIESRSRLRGFFCLLYCSASLWYVGYEQNDLAFNSPQNEIDLFHLSFAVFTLLSIIGFLVVCLCATRLLHAFVICVLLMAGFVLLNRFDLSICLRFPIVLHFVRNLNHYCSVLVVLPLIYQIMLTWLYSDNYYILGAKIRNEYEKYQKALNADSIDAAPGLYKDAFGQAFFDSKKDNSTDTSITNITAKFKEQLLVATKVPSQIDLLKYAIKNCFGHRVDQLQNIVVTPPIHGEELPQVEVDAARSRNGNKLLYKSHVQEYTPKRREKNLKDKKNTMTRN